MNNIVGRHAILHDTWLPTSHTHPYHTPILPPPTPHTHVSTAEVEQLLRRAEGIMCSLLGEEHCEAIECKVRSIYGGHLVLHEH